MIIFVLFQKYIRSLSLANWNTFIQTSSLQNSIWRHQIKTFSALLAQSPVNSPHKGQWRGAFMFSLICAWINGWVNNREAGDLRRHRAHYDVSVMFKNFTTGYLSWVIRFPRYWLVVRGIHCRVTGLFPSQRPVTRSFDVLFDLSLNKRLNKQSRRMWFETPSRS